MTEKRLNNQQKEAVEHSEGPLLIIAGAGTGKTTVITERIKWLVASGKAKPSEILALTFTRAAAAELRQRVGKELGEDVDRPIVSTLHSFALRTILQQGEITQLPQPLRIADDYELKLTD